MSLIAEDVVRLLDFPRENATDGLLQGQAVLDSLLHSVGAPLVTTTFQCSPYRTIAMGICLLIAGAMLLLGCQWRQRRWWIATGASLFLALIFVAGGFDAVLPRVAQPSLLVEVPPTGSTLTTVMLSAHFDTKTEPFDHVGRGILLLALVLSLSLAFAGQLWGKRRALRWALTVPATVTLLLAAFQGIGGFLTGDRSHGIRDNAVACALLLEFADRAVQRPLVHTRLQFAWWSGEEVGAQGSRRWAHLNIAALPDLLVNLESIGAGEKLAVSELEWTGRSLRRTDERLRRQLEEVAGAPVRRISAPLVTDAGPFLDLGVAGLTILNLPRNSRWLRGLHSHADELSGMHSAGIEASRVMLFELLKSLDAPAPPKAANSS